MITYSDLISHVIDYIGADSSFEAARFARRAALAAYNQVATSRNWSYYYERGRVTSVGQQVDGTVEYDQTGGVYERMLTLTGSTWPSWITYGVVRIANITYEVEALKSSTIITLTSNANPGADIASGTAYTAYQDTYPLPTNFTSADEFINDNNNGQLTYLHPREWLSSQRLHSGPATPRIYTITGADDGPGLMHVRFFPAPDQVYTFNYIYQRLPAPMVIDEYNLGLASITSGSTTVTGLGAAAWTSRMVGSVMRFSADSLLAPTGPSGGNPAYVERLIASVTSGTSLELTATAPNTLTGVKYAVSDRADVVEGAMAVYLQRECEAQVRQLKRIKPTEGEMEAHKNAMYMAFQADSRTFARRAAGQSPYYPIRLRDMPLGPDVS